MDSAPRRRHAFPSTKNEFAMYLAAGGRLNDYWNASSESACCLHLTV